MDNPGPVPPLSKTRHWLEMKDCDIVDLSSCSDPGLIWCHDIPISFLSQPTSPQHQQESQQFSGMINSSLSKCQRSVWPPQTFQNIKGAQPNWTEPNWAGIGDAKTSLCHVNQQIPKVEGYHWLRVSWFNHSKHGSTIDCFLSQCKH